MEALATISLAGTVVQFVDCSLKLLKSTSEIYAAASGCSDEILHLEYVYERLLGCSVELATASNHDVSDSKYPVAKHICELAIDCRKDCEKLLGVLKHLRTRDGARSRWTSFAIALRSMLKNKEIDSLTERLQRTQSTLTLHIYSITSRYQIEQVQELRALQNEVSGWNVALQGQLDRIQCILENLWKYEKEPYRETSLPFCQNHQMLRGDDVENLIRQISDLSVTTNDIKRKQSILRSLTYPHRISRQMNISEAHETTFSWAVQPLKPGTPGVQLLEWLRSGTGIFWVSGKPGSGKSTFMKYIAGSPEVLNALRMWAGSERLFLVSHWFWVAGTTIQKSRNGLLRSLVFDIFRQAPHLIEKILDDSCWPNLDAAAGESWTIPKLDLVLRRIAEQNLTMKLCFFIDGLDEYEGDHLELTQDLINLSRSSHIKLCVSSRPWNVFEDNLGSDAAFKLYIHELTETDVFKYTSNRLCDHPRWRILASHTPNATEIIAQITKRSMGVFLWVVLVTNLLRTGLNNDDSYLDLLERLDSFPSDLSEFFKHILESVEPFYHKRMAGALKLMLTANGPLDALIFYFHDRHYENENYAKELEPRVWGPPEWKDRTKEVSRRLNVYCRGLLETRNRRVTFLHRTVVDFLRTREMSDLLDEKLEVGFHPILSLLKAELAILKITDLSVSVNSGSIDLITENLFGFAFLLEESLVYSAEGDRGQSILTISSEIFDATEQLLSEKAIENTLETGLSMPHATCFTEDCFRLKMLGYNLAEHVRAKLKEEGFYFDRLCTPALYNVHETTFGPPDQSMVVGHNMKYRTLEALLECKSDPNEGFLIPRQMQKIIWTPWTRFLSSVIKRKGNEVFFQFRWLSAIKNILLLYLNHNADRNGKVYGTDDNEKSWEYSTVWSEVVLAGLHSELNKADKIWFLTILDALLAGHIDVSIPYRVVLPQNEVELRGRETFSDALYFSLEATYLSNTSPVRRQFLVAIVMRILLKAQNSHWDMDTFWKRIRSLFSTQELDRISRYCNSDTMPTDRGVKRSYNLDPQTGRHIKLSKLAS